MVRVELDAITTAGGTRLSRPQRSVEGRLSVRSRAGLAAGADAREGQDVVGCGGEDGIAVEVLRRREAMEVLRAVRRPARPDEQRDDRLNLQEDVRNLREQLLLTLRIEARLPLVEKRSRLRVVDVRPVTGIRRVLP